MAPSRTGSRPGSDRTSTSDRVGRDLGEFARFALVGASGVLVNLAVFNLTRLIWRSVHGDIRLAAEILANGLGFLVSVLTNYCLNRRWTFRSTGRVGSQLGKFLLVSVVAYLTNLLVFSFCRTTLNLPANPSQLIAIASVTPVNFLANKLWSFR